MYSLEEFDNLKTKVVKYIVYKNRTEKEIQRKFQNEDTELLSNVIDYLKEINYINDNTYIEKLVHEYIKLNLLSQKELRYKLYSKGLESDLVEDYFNSNQEKLEEYETQSAKKLYLKKQNSMELEEIKIYLMKKGYTKETIQEVIKE